MVLHVRDQVLAAMTGRQVRGGRPATHPSPHRKWLGRPVWNSGRDAWAKN
ncbi:hypothetical protein OHA25_48550 [Nonomuraea sp. NBC_00507]